MKFERILNPVQTIDESALLHYSGLIFSLSSNAPMKTQVLIRFLCPTARVMAAVPWGRWDKLFSPWGSWGWRFEPELCIGWA